MPSYEYWSCTSAMRVKQTPKKLNIEQELKSLKIMTASFKKNMENETPAKRKYKPGTVAIREFASIKRVIIFCSASSPFSALCVRSRRVCLLFCRWTFALRPVL